MYRKSTLNEETFPFGVDFRVQRYKEFLKYATIFAKKMQIAVKKKENRR